MAQLDVPNTAAHQLYLTPGMVSRVREAFTYATRGVGIRDFDEGRAESAFGYAEVNLRLLGVVASEARQAVADARSSTIEQLITSLNQIRPAGASLLTYPNFKADPASFARAAIGFIPDRLSSDQAAVPAFLIGREALSIVESVVSNADISPALPPGLLVDVATALTHHDYVGTIASQVRDQMLDDSFLGHNAPSATAIAVIRPGQTGTLDAEAAPLLSSQQTEAFFFQRNRTDIGALSAGRLLEATRAVLEVDGEVFFVLHGRSDWYGGVATDPADRTVKIAQVVTGGVDPHLGAEVRVTSYSFDGIFRGSTRPLLDFADFNERGSGRELPVQIGLDNSGNVHIAVAEGAPATGPVQLGAVMGSFEVKDRATPSFRGQVEQVKALLSDVSVGFSELDAFWASSLQRQLDVTVEKAAVQGVPADAVPVYSFSDLNNPREWPPTHPHRKAADAFLNGMGARGLDGVISEAQGRIDVALRRGASGGGQGSIDYPTSVPGVTLTVDYGHSDRRLSYLCPRLEITPAQDGFGAAVVANTRSVGVTASVAELPPVLSTLRKQQLRGAQPLQVGS